MVRRIPAPALAAFPAALALIAATACGSGSQTSTASGGGGGASATLTAQNTAFDPTTLSVPANTQVTISFTNKDSVKHSITFDDNSNSVDADGGSTTTLTFTSGASGTTIAFHCKYHPTQMKGTITVGAG